MLFVCSNYFLLTYELLDSAGIPRYFILGKQPRQLDTLGGS